VAFGAFGLFLAVYQGFELVVAFLADVFVDGHIKLRVSDVKRSPGTALTGLSIKINLWGVRKSHRRVVKTQPTVSLGIRGGSLRHFRRDGGLAADMCRLSQVF
jgi:hypothetical protein